jgi:peptidoglycan/LPS O-acetylase OafA/YrhL
MSAATPRIAQGAAGALASYVPALDGVRGLAITLVMVFHFAAFPNMTAGIFVDKVARGLASTGWAGVDLFFVLSGFLITGILLNTKETPRFFRTFYARRFLRIFPLYYAFLAVAFFIVPLLSPQLGIIPLRTQGWYWAYLSNVHFALLGGWERPLWLGHFWSLAVEEQFYLVWPFVVYATSGKTLVRVCITVILTALLMRLAFVLTGNAFARYVLTPCRMDALAAGALVAALMRIGVAREAIARGSRVAVVLGGLTVLVLGAWRNGLHIGDPVIDTVGYSALASLFGGLVALAVASPAGRVERTFSSSALRLAGRYAYGLYVFQQPVAVLLSPPRISIERLPLMAGSHLPALIVIMSVGFGLTGALAAASYHLFESKFLAMKRFFPYRLGIVGAERAGQSSLAGRTN